MRRAWAESMLSTFALGGTLPLLGKADTRHLYQDALIAYNQATCLRCALDGGVTLAKNCAKVILHPSWAPLSGEGLKRGTGIKRAAWSNLPPAVSIFSQGYRDIHASWEE